MQLGELLTIAVLTPAQAILVTVALLEGTGGTPRERVHAVVTADGTVDLTQMENGAPGVPLRDLLDEVVRNARRLPAHPQPHQLSLLHHLEVQAGITGDPVARATALREALAEVLGVDAVGRIRRELAALVDAFDGIAISRSARTVRVNGHAVGSSPVVRPVALPPPGHPRRQVGRRRARTRRVLVILVVVAVALVVGGYLVLRGPGSGLLDFSDGGSDAAESPRPAPSHAPGDQQTGHADAGQGRPFPALAAHSSGRVRGVVLQRTTSCGPATACGVTVTVHLAPADVSQVVGWRVGVAQRCARRVTWSPETTVTAQPGWTHVFASSTVQVPKGRSLALVALTSTPTRAQSRPVPVVGTSRDC